MLLSSERKNGVFLTSCTHCLSVMLFLECLVYWTEGTSKEKVNRMKHIMNIYYYEVKTYCLGEGDLGTTHQYVIHLIPIKYKSLTPYKETISSNQYSVKSHSRESALVQIGLAEKYRFKSQDFLPGVQMIIEHAAFTVDKKEHLGSEFHVFVSRCLALLSGIFAFFLVA
eukprot:GHVR01179875.1.p1 GENE.GHVR01179875.1~~GHVR01179875.1.p1  ORF type:complete len:169 (+),score=0.52 GHVR01179875.1:950-1456(+)